MSTKEQFIIKLRKARTQHLKWVNQIKLLVSGFSVDKATIPVNQSESPFGAWLYEEAMVFATSNSKNVLNEIDTLHTSCFEHYFKIFHTLDGKGEKGLLSSILGSKKPSANELMLAQKFYEELVKTSDELINRLRLFESQLLATSETKFEELVLAPEVPVDEIELRIEPQGKSNVQKMYRGQPVLD
ncbi:MAG: CZB domain-containing protein [Sulfurimonadaceae bacterium]|nr:CZB domain-containing protein [Sulfurimonadaceae bacterium]